VLKKKNWADFLRIIEFFTQKIVTKLSKIWLWDPGSGKNLFRIPDPGVKKAPDSGSRGQKGTGSRIRIRNTGTVLWIRIGFNANPAFLVSADPGF
jgi:hypothetical protein